MLKKENLILSLDSSIKNMSIKKLTWSLVYLLHKSFLLFIVIFIFCAPELKGQSANEVKWVGTWSTAPQLVEPNNNPPDPGLNNNTLRQVVHVSIGGDSLRMRFTNEFSTSSVTLKSVHIAVSEGNGSIDTTTDKTLYFNGQPEITIDAGSAITSDPFKLALQPLADVAITIYFGDTSPDVTGHPGSRTTSYILTGNKVAREDFSGAVTTDHWYVINAIDVLAPDSAYAVAILGNSITDGRGSGTNKQNRWPDELARRLHENPDTRHIAVLNEGIGGNCVLGDCLGPSALSRFNRDVIEQSSVRWFIILEGINDIGYAWGPEVGDNLINAYKQMIGVAHANGIFVYGATILPMKGSSYFSTDHESIRQTVNEWIRNSDTFDAVIDLDMAMRNPSDTLSLRPEADTGDRLHPNETGHRMMADAVDLSLFMSSDSLVFIDKSQTIYFEPECATVGESWNIIADSQASNGKYVTVKSGVQSLTEPPSGSEANIIIPFFVDSTETYTVYARINCPTADDDSYWVKMDSGKFQMINGLGTSGWEWKNFNDYTLTEGEHTLTIAYREDGAKLDKIGISTSVFVPMGIGEEAENICTTTGLLNSNDSPYGYVLGQNYPNPFNPTTTIEYVIPVKTNVTIKIFDLLGKEVTTLYDKIQIAGNHYVLFDGNSLSNGLYFCQMKTTDFVDTKKLILIK